MKFPNPHIIVGAPRRCICGTYTDGKIISCESVLKSLDELVRHAKIIGSGVSYYASDILRLDDVIRSLVQECQESCPTGKTTTPVPLDQPLWEEIARLKVEIKAKDKALAFAASTIKSGEPWTGSCEEVFGKALGHRHPPIPETPWQSGYAEGRAIKGDVLECPYAMNTPEAKEWTEGFESGTDDSRWGNSPLENR